MGSSLLASEMEVCLKRKGKVRLDQISKIIRRRRRIGKQEEEDHNIKGKSNKRSRGGRKVRDRWIK